MSCSSSLIDIRAPLVLDTSVLINLHASKYGERILSAIPNDMVVPQIVAGELEHETSRRNGEYSFLHALVSGGLVTLANLTDAEYQTSTNSRLPRLRWTMAKLRRSPLLPLDISCRL